jgi:fido (protein-threonine AMPylation protein)
MPLGNEGKLLAASLAALKEITDKRNSTIIESEELSRTHRERLEASGFLEPIMQGWYAFAKPGAHKRVETAWGSAYWEFVSRYLEKRFGDDYWLSPVGSLRLHAENYGVPPQLTICVPSPMNGPVPSPPKRLPGGATLYISGNSQPPSSTVIKSNLRVMTPEDAIANLPASVWAQMPTDAVSVLGSISGTGSLLKAILDGGMITRAGATAGALRHIGRSADADRIISTIKGLGHDIREVNPLEDQQNLPTFNSRKPLSAAGTRIKLLWSQMRSDVLTEFVEAPREVSDVAKYLADIDDRYVSDAYNSLSIEGYKVTAELIGKVANQDWKPETDAADFETHNALAAQGYWLAFTQVKKDVASILEGTDVSELLWHRHQEWFKAMFQPFVTIGQQKAHVLAGYRTNPVYINGSDHVPYSPDAVTDGMEALFDCIENEEDPRVKAVLGPYLFTFIHPYMDGNGRNARFLMNALLAEGGFPWTVIPVERRTEYMGCLEAASMDQNIKPLAAFIAELVASPPPPRPKETAWPKREGCRAEPAPEQADGISDDGNSGTFRDDITAPGLRGPGGEPSRLVRFASRVVGIFRRAQYGSASTLISSSSVDQLIAGTDKIVGPVFQSHVSEVIVFFQNKGNGGGERWKVNGAQCKAIEAFLVDRFGDDGLNLLQLVVQNCIRTFDQLGNRELGCLPGIVRKAVEAPITGRPALELIDGLAFEDVKAVVEELHQAVNQARTEAKSQSADRQKGEQRNESMAERVRSFKDKLVPETASSPSVRLKPRF